MGQIKQALPLKLTIGFIFKDEVNFNQAISILEDRFAKIDFESTILPFNRTDYYRDEFGDNLKRKFISFENLIPQDNLSQIKKFTNKIEKDLSFQNKRTVNIDPGLLGLAKFILASTKDYAHRIYIGDGIYAEITLLFKDKSFLPLDWTYPDYRSIEYIENFNKIRQIYASQIKNSK